MNKRIGILVRDGKHIYYAILRDGIRVENESLAEVDAYVRAEERNEASIFVPLDALA